MRVLRLAHHAVVSAWRQRERELRALGVNVRLISAQRWNEGGRDVTLGADGDSFVTGARTIGRHPSVFLYDPRPIWRALGGRPDLIDLHEEPGALATAEVLLLRLLRRSKAPYVLYSAQNIEKRYPPPFRWFERWALRGAAAAYVCNVEAGEILRRKGLTGRVVSLPLGVDVQLFAPAARGTPSAEPVIGYVGRLEPHKGVDVLLRAVVDRPRWRVQITGDGPERAALGQLASALGIADRVRFLGFAGGDDLAARYRELDVLAVPSLPWPGWREQFCRVAVESMASGVPVVASDSGAIPDVVGDAGLLVEPGVPDALRRGLDEALEPARWTQLVERGLARSTEFTWRKVAAGHKAMYDACLSHDPPVSGVGARADPEVIIVAYGPPDPLDGCLSQLGGALPVTVIDNSSLRATRDVAERHGARYIDAGRNRGFGAGVNLGLRALAEAGSSARDVLLLNPDARIDAAGVRRLHAELHRSPGVAVVGAVQTEPGSGANVRVWWPFPTPWGAWVEAVGLGGLRRSRGFAIGSVLLLRAEALESVGFFDERFFLYSEETDWQRRARSLGWTIRVADVSATHEGAGTGGDPGVRERHFYESAQKYIRKHHGTRGLRVYRAANIVGAAARGLLLPGERGAQARRRRDLFRRGVAAHDADSAPHVLHVICTDAFAGAERYVLNSALSLRARGFRVTVVGGAEASMRRPLERSGATWLPGRTVRQATRAALSVHDVDIVNTHMTEADTVGAVVGMLRRLPVVSTRHFAGTRGSSPLARLVSRLAQPAITAQIAISHFVADNIEGESTVVQSGVADVAEGADAAERAENRERVVLVAQRLEPEKSTAVALRAWAASAERSSGPWRMLIAGDGSQRDVLEALAERLGIAASVDFLGFRSDVDALMRRAEIFFAPAPREPMGLSVLEAMAHGLPVVAAAGGGHVETVGSVADAALFRPGDADEAAALLDALMRDSDRRQRYGRALRERQRSAFTAERQTDATRAVFDAVLAESM